MLIKVPISSPYGCGLISIAFGGIVCVALSNRSDGMATIAEEMARKQKEISVSEFF